METGNEKYYKYGEKTINKENSELYNNIINHSIKLDKNLKFKVRFYLYEHNMEKLPKCYCGNDVKFVDMRMGFREFCSRKCMYNSDVVKEQRKKTNLEKYGVDNPAKSNKIKEKVRSTNRKKFGKDYPLQSKEKIAELKEYFLREYGVENPSQIPDYQKKFKSTMLERYGVEHPMFSDEIKNKLKETNIDRYGVEWGFESNEIKEKIKNTMLERYGVEHALQSEEIMNKLKQTNLKRYGVDNVLKSIDIQKILEQNNLEKYGVGSTLELKDVRDKIKETNLDRYSVEFPIKLKKIKDKIKKANLEKYGSDHMTKSEKYRKSKFKLAQDSNYIKYVGNRKSLFNCDLGKNHTFEINNINYHNRKRRNIHLCTTCYPISEQRSIKEDMLFEYICSIYNGEIIQSYRDGLEIDIYLPDLNLGFEFNGLYWHSEKFLNKDYHLNKSNYFKNKGINIIHIWEDEWDFKNKKIKSKIENILNLNESIINIDKCEIKLITDTIVSDFFTENSLYDINIGDYNIGLYYYDILVFVASFKENELISFDNLIGFNVNGLENILKYFIENNNYDTIVTYIENNWLEYNLFNQLGFNLIDEGEFMNKSIVNENRTDRININIIKFSLTI